MKKKLLLSLLFAPLTLLNASSSFGDVNSPVNDMGELYYYVKAECEHEFSNYCSKIVYGKGRGISCLRKFEDKLSPQCEQAFHESMEKLGAILPKFLDAIDVCKEDVEKNCSDLNFRRGQIGDCLKLNQDKISKPCRSTLQAYGWMK